MHERAKHSLTVLKELCPERKYVVLSNDISRNWYSCSIPPTRAIEMIKWANDHCVGKFSRDYATYYFENEKDAFSCKLRWGR